MNPLILYQPWGPGMEYVHVLSPEVPPLPPLSLITPPISSLTGHLDPHAGRMQVPRGVRLLRGKDVLASCTTLPPGGPCTKGEV